MTTESVPGGVWAAVSKAGTAWSYFQHTLYLLQSPLVQFIMNKGKDEEQLCPGFRVVLRTISFLPNGALWPVPNWEMGMLSFGMSCASRGWARGMGCVLQGCSALHSAPLPRGKQDLGWEGRVLQALPTSTVTLSHLH